MPKKPELFKIDGSLESLVKKTVCIINHKTGKKLLKNNSKPNFDKLTHDKKSTNHSNSE